MARMHAREIDQAFAEDITEQELEIAHEMVYDLQFIEPEHDEYIDEYDARSMDWAFEDGYDYGDSSYASPEWFFED